MTVKELINELQNFDQNIDIMISLSYFPELGETIKIVNYTHNGKNYVLIEGK